MFRMKDEKKLQDSALCSVPFKPSFAGASGDASWASASSKGLYMTDSRCARAACWYWKKKGQRRVGLVRRITVIIDEIAAHPPDLTQFLVLISIKDLEVRVRVDERVIVEFIFLILVVGV